MKTGQRHNPETIARLRENHLGKLNAMYGKTPSIETRELISKALKGHKVTQATRELISKGNRGRRKKAPNTSNTSNIPDTSNTSNTSNTKETPCTYQ